MAEPHRTRVLIADDHQVIREGLESLLSSALDLEVVGEAENGRDALDQVNALSPDVVLMDLAGRA
jgi:YesN/AraC family two-component response regulator